MKDDVKQKLTQLGITGDVASEIMSDVFGKKIDGGKDWLTVPLPKNSTAF